MASRCESRQSTNWLPDTEEWRSLRLWSDHLHVAWPDHDSPSLNGCLQRLIGEVEQNEVRPALGDDQAIWNSR